MYKLMLSFLLVLAVHGHTLAATIWDESIDGDLSNDSNSPTPIFFVLGSTQDKVIGTVGGSNPGEFFDAATIDVFYGFCLESIILVDYVAADENTTSGFNFFEGQGVLGTYLGGSASGPADIGSNVVANATPVSAGSYTLDIREGTPGQAYDIDYVLCKEAFWNEAFDGDLSNDTNAPTALGTLPLTGNEITGVVGGSGDNFWDIISFSVPEGFTADVILRAYIAAGGNVDSGFNFHAGLSGISGAVVSSESFGPADLGQSVLVNGPLPAGDYSLLIAEGTENQQYGFDFVLNDLIFENNFEQIIL